MNNTLGEEINEWKTHFSDYYTAKSELLKLQFVDRLTVLISGAIVKLVALYLLLLILLFSSLALAFYLGNIFESNPIGFICVSAIYTVILIIFLLFKRPMVEQSVIKALIKFIFGKHDEL